MGTLGIIVNPVAGVGGRVGLKGSDGREILIKALELGARREAPGRAELALLRIRQAIGNTAGNLTILAFPGEMGEDEARQAGFQPQVLEPSAGHGTIEAGGQSFAETTPGDTEEAARRMAAAGADLILFAGGDGTARNICTAIGDTVPALGIPAGVKIHSAVYANTPASAGDLAGLFLAELMAGHQADADPPMGGRGRSQSQKGSAVRLREAEVMDIDEDAFRHDRVSASLYGYLRVPYERRLIQSPKAGSQPSDEAAAIGIGNDVIHQMVPGDLYLIGAGTTTRPIMRLLGLPHTLLGVDAVRDGLLVAGDAAEGDLLRLIAEATSAGARAHIVVAVIGGQGHVFGRGSQQFSPAVIRAVGRQRIVVLATQTKLLALDGAPLLVDTGDPQLDAELAGWIKVVTGQNQRTMYRIA